MDDLDDLLTGRDRFCDRLPCCFLLDGFDKVARDGQRHICLQQRDPHLSQRGFYIIFAQRALLGQPVKDATEAIGQIFKHGRSPP